MKKTIKLMLYLMTVMFAANANAQLWTASEPTDGGTYYLYNVGMRGFLIGGANRGSIAPSPSGTVTLEYDASTSTSDGDAFRIDTRDLRNNGGTDQWMVENIDDDYVYIDVAKSHSMHSPWRFEPVAGKTNVYHLVITSLGDAGRRLEIDSRNNGVPDLNNRAGVSPYTRSTRQSNAGGNCVAENDEWILVTPADYESFINDSKRTDYTSLVGTSQSSWTGASEFGSDVKVTTFNGTTTGIPAFYGSSDSGEKISQTVNVPNGIYEVKLFAHSHNERADYGTSAPGTAVTGYPNCTYLFAESGESRETVYINSRGRDPLGWTKAEFLAPYTISNVVVKNGQIKFGLYVETANTTQWQAIQIYSLTRTGDLPLTEKIEAYETALANANATASDTDIPSGYREVLQSVIDANDNVDITDADALDSATEALNAATQTAEAGRAPFAEYKAFVLFCVDAIKSQTEVYSDEGGTNTGILDTAVDAANAKANSAATASTISEAADDVRHAVGVFIKATNIPTKYFDISSLIINPGFESSRNGGWTYVHDGGAFNWLTRETFKCIEFFNCTYDLNQTITGMPKGYYKVEVNGHYRPNNEYAPEQHIQSNVDGYLYINGGTPVALQVLRNNLTSISEVHGLMDNGEYVNIAKGYIDSDDSNLTFGIKCETQRQNYSWTMADDFKLYYTIEDIDLFLEPYNEALASAQAIDSSSKMNALEKEELLASIAADASLDKTNIASIQDATARLENATSIATASISAYENANTAIVRLESEMDNTNVVTADAVAAFNSYRTAYENGTFSDDDANALMRRLFRDGVNKDPANWIDDYLLSAWKEGETQMKDYEGKLYINTWSTETDIEGFTYPFYEFADGWPNSTVAHTFTATMTDMEAGTYKIDIWARTQINGNNTAEPKGISFQLNEGPKVMVEGDVNGRFRAGQYSVYGTVNSDGILNLTLNIEANTVGTWLSFKNVRFTKISDPETITISENTTFIPSEQVANVELERTFNANAWNTLVLPFEVSDVKGVFGETTQVARYIGATEDSGLWTLNFEESDYIPANTPVFIYGVSSSSPYIINFAQIKTGEPIIENDIRFVGSYASSIDLQAGDFFIGADNIIYKVGDTSTVHLKGTRAYFTPSAGVTVKGLNSSLSDLSTGINTIEDDVISTDEIYNISGQRLNKVQRGINIINGKKVFIK